ncbi:MAG: hypothetical protein LH609_22830 [Rudanella sp.]|nr:hypothetical protein [Rudanella sp.]
MKTTFSSFVAVILLTITTALAQQSPVFVKDGKAIRAPVVSSPSSATPAT